VNMSKARRYELSREGAEERSALDVISPKFAVPVSDFQPDLVLRMSSAYMINNFKLKTDMVEAYSPP